MREFSIVLDGGRILANGDLWAFDAPRLEAFFNGLPLGAYVVEASQLTLVPEAVTAWISATRHLGSGHRFDFAPSQLASWLELDERYDHPASFFADAFDSARGSNSTAFTPERLGFVG